jgi:hypothetical protein
MAASTASKPTGSRAAGRVAAIGERAISAVSAAIVGRCSIMADIYRATLAAKGRVRGKVGALGNFPFNPR